MGREFISGAALGVLVVLLAAVIPARPPAHAEGPAGQVVWAVSVSLPPAWFYPADANGLLIPFIVYYALHDGLAKPMPASSMAPSLAESWSTSAEEVRRTPGLTLKPIHFYGEQWVLFTEQWDPKSLWADQRVRLAVNHAIDRQALNQSLTLGFSRMTGSIIPRDFEFSWPAPPYPLCVRKAKQLLTDAGYPHGFEAEFWTDTDFAEQSEAVANSLAAIAIRVRIHALECPDS